MFEPEAGLPKVVTVLAIAGVIVASIDAQAYGFGSPGTGGAVPSLHAPKAWPGSTTFGLTVHHGIGGGNVIFAMSPAQAQLLVGATTILIDVNDPGFATLGSATLSGPAGAPGAGSAMLGLSLAGLPPSLIGSVVYCQAAVDDFPMPGSPAATQGLRVELTHPPTLFVGSRYAGGVYGVFDATTGTVLDGGALPPGETVGGAVFGAAGTELFVSFGQSGSIARSDVTALPQSWTLPFFDPTWQFSDVAIDHVHRLLYAAKRGPQSSAQPALVAIDVDASSPSFGAIVGSTTSTILNGWVNAWIGTWALSPSGRVAAFCGLPPQQQLPRMILVDCDPSSPTWLQVTVNVVIPTSTTSQFPTRVRVSSDDQDVFILKTSLTGAGYELANYRIAAATWTDFNPGSMGLQHLGYFAAPSVPLGPDFDLSSDGQFLVAWGHVFLTLACDLLTRIDLSPASPGSFTSVTWNLAAAAAATSLDLSGDDTVVALASLPLCPAALSAIVQVDAATGATVGSPLPLPVPPPGPQPSPSWVVRFN